MVIILHGDKQFEWGGDSSSSNAASTNEISASSDSGKTETTKNETVIKNKIMAKIQKEEIEDELILPSSSLPENSGLKIVSNEEWIRAETLPPEYKDVKDDLFKDSTQVSEFKTMTDAEFIQSQLLAEKHEQLVHTTEKKTEPETQVSEIKGKVESVVEKREVAKQSTEPIEKEKEEIVYKGNLTYEQYQKLDPIPDRVTGSLLFSGCCSSARNMKFPEIVEGSVYLDRLSTAKGFIPPRIIGKNLHLSGLKTAEDLVLPQIIGGDLYLENIESVAELELSQTTIDGVIWLNDGLDTEEIEALVDRYDLEENENRSYTLR